MLHRLLTIIFALLFLSTVLLADDEIALLRDKYPSISATKYLSLPNNTDLRGWDNLVIKLAAAGIPKDHLLNVYSSKSFPRFETVYFGLNPGESKNLYRGIATTANAKKVRNFITQNKTYFKKAQKEFDVDPEIIAALLFIESRFGANTGKESVIYRLSRLANIGDPINLKNNFIRARKMNSKVKLEQVLKRAHYLENTFLPEAAASFAVANENNISVHSLKGSSAGAFGWPQFLPGSYVKYAVDFDSDGKKSLHSAPDAIGSVARYLSANGWRSNLANKSKRQVIWTYNKSNPYIDAALNLSDLTTRY